MLANWITFSRFPLLAAVLGMFHWGSPAARMAAVGLLFAGLMLDTVDGVVARTRGETSLFGSVLDIAADRTYELVLWIWFAGLCMIPLAIPVIVAVRTTLTDALRSVGVAAGSTPLTQHRTALGLFLVNSTWMRTGYAVSKVLSFCGLGLALALQHGGLHQIAEGLAWITTGLCVVRGLPVLAHAAREPALRSPMGERHA
jgi:CDP-diacylglycerol---glycerol-3-phosphate 3-phosphatidyltransferase